MEKRMWCASSSHLKFISLVCFISLFSCKLLHDCQRIPFICAMCILLSSWSHLMNACDGWSVSDTKLTVAFGAGGRRYNKTNIALVAWKEEMSRGHATIAIITYSYATFLSVVKAPFAQRYVPGACSKIKMSIEMESVILHAKVFMVFSTRLRPSEILNFWDQ